MWLIADAPKRLRERAFGRLRGEANIKRLVADGLQLGENTHIARPVFIDGLHPWLITIDDYATLGIGVHVITHDASLSHHIGLTRIATVIVGKRAYVGSGAILLPGTNIGEDSVVAAGAVVHGEVPPGSLVVGNPAKVSKIKAVVAWNRTTAKGAPSWPREGWSMASGITEARKREQREALADGVSGYVPATAAPDGPHGLREQGPPDAR